VQRWTEEGGMEAQQKSANNLLKVNAAARQNAQPGPAGGVANRDAARQAEQAKGTGRARLDAALKEARESKAPSEPGRDQGRER
jgi:hypothetical protein